MVKDSVLEFLVHDDAMSLDSGRRFELGPCRMSPVPAHAELSWERCSAATSLRSDDALRGNLSTSEGTGASEEGRELARPAGFAFCGWEAKHTRRADGSVSARFSGNPLPKVKCLIFWKSKSLCPGPENESSATIAALFWVGDKD